MATSKVSVSASDSEESEEIAIVEDGSAIAKPLVMASRMKKRTRMFW